MAEGKTNALIFGASGTIGSALARRISESGGQVVAVGRNTNALSELTQLDNVQTIEIESMSAENVQQAVDQAFDQVESLSSVVNCVGSLFLKAAHQTSDDEWSTTIETNLSSCFRILKSSIPKLRKSGGSIAFVSSAAAQIGMANHEAIAAAKAGIEGLTRSAAATYASRGIRVNCVAPGLVQSEMTRQFWESDKAREMSEMMNPMARLGQADDIASCLAWLIDPKNSWVTGQAIGVDGGMSELMLRPKTKA